MPTQDRIADIWGARTPYARGGEWPDRVDQHLAAGIREEDVQRWVQTASTLHSNGDAFDVAVRDGRLVGVRGRSQDRVNHGRLGPKDLFGWQAIQSPDRLTRPLVRRDGRLVECSWDEAMDAVVRRTRALLEEQGPSAIGFYTTGQLFLEEYYTLALVAHGGIRTNHVDGNTRLCTATAAEALKESFGSDGQPGSYTDVDHADVIALFGHNVAETQTVLWMRILDRLAGDDPPAVHLRRPAAHPGGAGRDRAPGAAPGHERRADERAAARDHRGRQRRRGLGAAPTPSATRTSRRPSPATRPRSSAPSATCPPTTSAPLPGSSARPRRCSRRCSRASTSPTRRRRRPCRSTTCTCSAA